MNISTTQSLHCIVCSSPKSSLLPSPLSLLYPPPPLSPSLLSATITTLFLCPWGFHFILCIDFWVRGREGKREGTINVRDKHRLVASCTCPDGGLNPQPRHVPWPGIKLASFCFVGQRPTNWATPAGPAHELFSLFPFCSVPLKLLHGTSFWRWRTKVKVIN